jgi:hypothetical protein
MTKAELMALIDQRDELDAKIDAGMTELGLDAKGVKAIRKAAAAKAAAEKTLAELMGIDPETATKITTDSPA